MHQTEANRALAATTAVQVPSRPLKLYFPE
jgi:hypothetical protein